MNNHEQNKLSIIIDEIEQLESALKTISPEDFKKILEQVKEEKLAARSRELLVEETPSAEQRRYRYGL